MRLLAFGTWHYSREIVYGSWYWYQFKAHTHTSSVASYTYLPLMWTVRYHVFQKLNFRKQRHFRLYFLKYSSTHANRRFIYSSLVGGQSWLSSQRIKKMHSIEGYFSILKFHQPLETNDSHVPSLTTYNDLLPFLGWFRRYRHCGFLDHSLSFTATETSNQIDDGHFESERFPCNVPSRDYWSKPLYLKEKYWYLQIAQK